MPEFYTWVILLINQSKEIGKKQLSDFGSGAKIPLMHVPLWPLPGELKRVHYYSWLIFTHLKIFKIMIPSMAGKSTNFPSTSSRIHRWRSLQVCLLTILRKLICTYTFLLCNLQGTKIFQYGTCPAERVTYNFHSSCKHMYSLCNKEHKGVTVII